MGGAELTRDNDVAAFGAEGNFHCIGKRVDALLSSSRASIPNFISFAISVCFFIIPFIIFLPLRALRSAHD